MESNYVRCLANTLVHEGGYANHPSDPGGATMRGVTQATYNAWRRKKGLPQRHVKQITEDELQSVYREGFWVPVAGPDLPKGIDYVAFDGGVNSGPSRGVRWVAQALGNSSMSAAATAREASKNKDLPRLAKAACAARVGFLRSLRTFSVFGKGWLRRVASVEAISVKMILEGQPDKLQEEIAKNKNEAENKKGAATNGAVATGGTGAAGGTVIEPSSFDWLGWTIFALIIVAIVGTLAYFLYTRKFNVERIKAYKELAEDKLEVSWEMLKKELF